MRIWRRRLTVRQKLMGLATLSSATALLSASVAFLVLDAHTFRETLVSRLSTEARIISFNCISPVLFGDAEAASATLQGLRADPAVRAALVFQGETARPFASYAPDSEAAAALQARATGPDGHAFIENRLLVFHPILFEEKSIGRLAVATDLGALGERQRRYAAILPLILAGSLLVALAISKLAERSLSRPIIHLAETARAVSSRTDYSVRAASEGRDDEIGELIATFNEMLDHIEHQNNALEQARVGLELRVENRTRELALANKELEAFSYSVSHDLRAPLRAIDGFSKALLATCGDKVGEQGRHYLDRVRAGTQRMGELIEDLLKLAKLSRKELVRESVDVSRIASRVADELARRPPIRNVQCDVAEGMMANADPQLLTILLENLVGNARKFSAKRAEPRVEIGCRADNGETAFYVRDNGAGFDMAYVDKLFGAFQRLHDASDFEGTGIGLATVQRIVARHGGRAWATGGVDKGATFYFTLERKQ